jgi:uncharacterized membrane protein
MRAFAVIMMIQGHTIDTFLADEYRTMDSIGYSIWHTMRGFTAPIFMFTAGLIFTYLLKSDHYDFLKNPRIKKGLKRGLLLIGIGYLLRYPTYKIFDFSNVGQSQWNIFFAVDALHLIGFGILVIIFSVFLAKRAHINLNLIIYSIVLFLLLFSPMVNKIEWNNFLPQYLSSYLTNSYGSLFPLFPWLVYVLVGALLGNYLYRNDGIFFKKRFSFTLTVLGSSFILGALAFFSLEYTFEGEMSHWFYANGIIFLRVGYVILINGIIAFIVRKFNSMSSLIKETGKKTLLLYVLHVVILYGCAFFPGFYSYYAKSFTPIETTISVLLMVGVMLSVVLLSEKVKTLRKQKIALNRV